MQTGRGNLRIPRRAIAQWERVKAKLAAQIEARGQEADGPTVFCLACAMLDEATGGPGCVAEEGAPYYEAPAPAPPRPAELLPPYDPSRKAADQRDLAKHLRASADRLDRDAAEYLAAQAE